ncbi:MAG TPA: D-glycerate dehydrogenase [Eudoraea sp.]|nr:D-glycerate dehydrogenase [Eudoraea sp.]
MKVLISRLFPVVAEQLLKKEGFTVISWDKDRPMSAMELVSNAKKVNALLCASSDRIDAGFLKTCSHLDIISQFSVGYDNIDVPAATELGIAIGNAPGAMNEATADIAFGLMLAVSRKMFAMHKSIIEGKWSYFRPTANLGIELKHKTLGIFGLGRIGMEMAKRCRGAYEMKIIYHNRTANPLADAHLDASLVTFNELLAQSDIISVHCALTPETKGIFNLSAFDRMKRSAIFINTSRGAVHCEPDLIHALESGSIWGAGLDVTDPEPMSPDNPLLSMENVCVLPHIGSATVEARDEMARLAAENIISYYKNGKVPHLVNP